MGFKVGMVICIDRAKAFTYRLFRRVETDNFKSNLKG